MRWWSSPAASSTVSRRALNCASTAPNTFVADAGATGSNSALTGLDNVTGEFDLENGATVAVGGDLVDSGGIFIDNNGTEGGSQLTIAGTLTNSGTLQIGNGALSGDDGVTAAAVDNTGRSSSSAAPQTATGPRSTSPAPPASAPPASSPAAFG